MATRNKRKEAPSNLEMKNKMLQLDAQTYQILYLDIHISRLNLAYNKQGSNM